MSKAKSNLPDTYFNASTMSQNQKILKHLKEKGSITSLEAIIKYRVLRLSGRVKELREAGHDIQTVMVESNNPGSAGNYARYHLKCTV